MKVRLVVFVVVALASTALHGMQQKLLQGQIQNNSLDSTASNGSLPSIGYPDPFGPFDESVLSSVRIAPAFRDQLVEPSGKLLDNNDQKHEQPNSANSLQSPLLIQEDPKEPRTNSQIHDMYVKPGDEPGTASLLCKRSRHVALYTTLFILGLVHGAVNKNLSGGAWNEHFWKAPWREWEIGAGANALELFAAALCYYCFQIKADLTPRQQDWIAWPLMMGLLGGGQMLGESMPTPESNGWRNIAVNMWVVPTALWYLIVGIRGVRGYYARKPLLILSEGDVSL